MTLRTLIQSSLLTCAVATGLSLSPILVEAGDPDKKTKEKAQKEEKNKGAVEKNFRGEVNKNGVKKVFTDPEEFKKHLKELEADIDALRADLKETRKKIMKRLAEARQKLGDKVPQGPENESLKRFRQSMLKKLRGDLKDFEKQRRDIFKDFPGLKQKSWKKFKGRIEKNGESQEFDDPEEFEKARRGLKRFLERFENWDFKKEFKGRFGEGKGSFKGVIQHNGKTMEFDNREDYEKALKEIQKEKSRQGF